MTDSVGIVQYNDEQAGIKNLLEIYSKMTGESIESIVAKYDGKGYGDFKQDTAEIVAEGLRPIREKTKELLSDKTYLESVYREGAEKAEAIARKTLRKVHKKIGFLPRG